jgi:hypothetical protein
MINPPLKSTIILCNTSLFITIMTGALFPSNPPHYIQLACCGNIRSLLEPAILMAGYIEGYIPILRGWHGYIEYITPISDTL